MWVIPEDLDNFSPKKDKNLGEQKFARLSVSNFRGRIIEMFACHALIKIKVVFCFQYCSDTGNTN